MSQFKLSVRSTYSWPVEIKLATDEGQFIDRKINVLFNRKSMDEVATLQRQFEQDRDEKAMLRALVAGWKDQDLLLDENDQPAPYSADAFEFAMTVAGVSVALMNAFQESFNGGGLRRKN